MESDAESTSSSEGVEPGGFAPVPAPALTGPAGAGSSIRSLGPGAWSWFGDPRSVYGYGHTFIAYVAPSGALMVVSIGTDGVSRSVLAHEPAADDHDVPSLAILPSGHIVAYYSHHVGPALHWRVTHRPYDITAWGPEQTLGTNRIGVWGNTYTYPHVVWLSAEQRAYLFWRGGDKLPDYSTAPTLNGPWTPARTMIHVGGEARPYLRIADDGHDRMLFAFTDAHPREGVSSLYFAQYSQGMLRRASGESIAALGTDPITPDDADLVWDAHAQHSKAWVWDVAISKHGNPVITFVVFRGNLPRHEYHWARWTGSGWEVHVLADGGATITTDPAERWYSAGIVLDPRDPQIVYAAVPDGKYHEIARYQTNDGGHHWTRHWITQDSNTDNLRPYVPRGLPPDQNALVWLRGAYGTYTHFGTSVFALGT